MGLTHEAKCKKCGADFQVDSGGGFDFHKLRCDHCGKTLTVRFDDILDLHVRFVKGLDTCYSATSMEFDRQVQQDLDVEPLSEDNYRRKIESHMEACGCGGSYVFDAPMRCPKCHTTEIDLLTMLACYD